MSSTGTPAEVVRVLMEQAGLPAEPSDVELLAMAYPSVTASVARLHRVPCDDDEPVLGSGTSEPRAR